MGAGLSITEAAPSITSFQKLLQNARDARIYIDRGVVDDLSATGQVFCESYSRCIDGGKIEPDSPDYVKIFKKISGAFDALAGFCRFRPDQRKAVSITTFQNDIGKFFTILSNCIRGIHRAQESLLRAVVPATFLQSSIEINYFTRSFSVDKLPNFPGYSLRFIPLYTLLGQIMETKSRFLSIVAPHNAGKTCSVPLMFAVRMCEEKLAKPFLILVEKDPIAVGDLQRFFSDTVPEDDGLSVVRSVDAFVKELQGKSKNTLFLGVFTTAETLRIISQTDPASLFTKCRFILDDMHERSIETDVLFCQLQQGMLKPARGDQLIPGQLILISATPDPVLVSRLGDVEVIAIPSEPHFTVTTKTVKAKRTLDITRKLVLFILVIAVR
jgi:hypothetical protein